MQVCFIGHRTIQNEEKLKFSLRETIIDLINKGATTFLFGSKSAFDELALEIVTALKEIYPFVKRVYVRSAYKNIEKSYENYLHEFYEETYFPPKLENAGKYSYVERNFEMINNSIYCGFYYNENYIATLNKGENRNIMIQENRKSGTKVAYNYAVKKNKKIINLYK